MMNPNESRYFDESPSDRETYAEYARRAIDETRARDERAYRASETRNATLAGRDLADPFDLPCDATI